MPIYQFVCLRCKKKDDVYLTFKEFDSYKAGTTTQFCKCGTEMQYEINPGNMRVLVGNTQAYIPKICHSCVKLPRVNADYNKGGCQRGTKCRGFMPRREAMDMARRVTRSQYKKELKEGKIKPRIPFK